MSQNTSIITITCPFQFIIPNRTPVPAVHITVSPRNFIIKHTRPSRTFVYMYIASVELASQQQSDSESTRRTTQLELSCLFHSYTIITPQDGYRAQQTFRSCYRTRSHIISSPSCDRPTTPPSRVIPISNPNSATSPHPASPLAEIPVLPPNVIIFVVRLPSRTGLVPGPCSYR